MICQEENACQPESKYVYKPFNRIIFGKKLMFDLDEDENDYYAELADLMLSSAGIMIEQDCDDLRPMIVNVLMTPNVSDFYISISTFTIGYAGRETNNWRTYLTTQNLEEFFDNNNVENMAYHLSTLTQRLGKRHTDNAM